jgi:hypothetical protein
MYVLHFLDPLFTDNTHFPEGNSVTVDVILHAFYLLDADLTATMLVTSEAHFKQHYFIFTAISTNSP